MQGILSFFVALGIGITQTGGLILTGITQMGGLVFVGSKWLEYSSTQYDFEAQKKTILLYLYYCYFILSYHI